jgi:hypothetical protein
MCSDSFVTDAMKSRIAAHAAAFRKSTLSPFGSECLGNAFAQQDRSRRIVAHIRNA